MWNKNNRIRWEEAKPERIFGFVRWLLSCFSYSPTPTLKYIEHIVTCVPTPLFTTSHHTNLVCRSKWIQQHRNFFDVAACGDLLLFSLPISLPNSSKLKATESREWKWKWKWNGSGKRESFSLNMNNFFTCTLSSTFWMHSLCIVLAYSYPTSTLGRSRLCCGCGGTSFPPLSTFVPASVDSIFLFVLLSWSGFFWSMP